MSFIPTFSIDFILFSFDASNLPIISNIELIFVSSLFTLDITLVSRWVNLSSITLDISFFKSLLSSENLISTEGDFEGKYSSIFLLCTSGGWSSLIISVLTVVDFFLNKLLSLAGLVL